MLAMKLSPMLLSFVGFGFVETNGEILTSKPFFQTAEKSPMS